MTDRSEHILKALRLTVENLENSKVDDFLSPFVGEVVIGRQDVLDAIDLFLQSAQQAPGASPDPSGGWQEIASAPKDGTRILIWAESPSTGHRSVHVAWWAIPYEAAPTGWWETGLYGTSHPVVPEFTKGWMPLPPPPSSEPPSDEHER